jgi:nucleoside-diphosphate-sugar epimerase
MRDSAAEEKIQVFSPIDYQAFFAQFPYLNEYVGDERLDFKDMRDFHTEDFRADFAHNIYYDYDNPELLHALCDHLNLKQYTGNLILASDYEVYGYKTAAKVPLDERAECTPESIRGKSRYELEKVVTKFARGAPYHSVILRLSLVFGPYMDANVLSDLMQQALLNQDLEIDPPASRTFDFLYVTDAINAIEAAFKTNASPGVLDVYNIGSGYEVKIGNVARDLRHLVKSESSIVYKPVIAPPENKGFRTQLSIAKAEKELEWAPFTETQRGFLQTCSWMQTALPPEEVKYGAQNIVKTYPQLSEEFGKFKVGEESTYASNETYNKQLKEAAQRAKGDEI